MLSQNTTYEFCDRIDLGDFISKYRQLNNTLRDVHSEHYDHNEKVTSINEKTVIC